MADEFQRLLVSRDAAPAVLSLNVQAAMGPVREPERSQFVLLMRHFLERFFNHETASPDEDGKTRLVQLAVATGIARIHGGTVSVAGVSPRDRVAAASG